MVSNNFEFVHDESLNIVDSLKKINGFDHRIGTVSDVAKLRLNGLKDSSLQTFSAVAFDKSGNVKIDANGSLFKFIKDNVVYDGNVLTHSYFRINGNLFNSFESDYFSADEFDMIKNDSNKKYEALSRKSPKWFFKSKDSVLKNIIVSDPLWKSLFNHDNNLLEDYVDFVIDSKNFLSVMKSFDKNSVYRTRYEPHVVKSDVVSNIYLSPVFLGSNANLVDLLNPSQSFILFKD